MSSLKHSLPAIILALLVLIFVTLFGIEYGKNRDLRSLIGTNRNEMAVRGDRDRVELDRLRRQIDVYRQESEALRKKLADSKSGSPRASDDVASSNAGNAGKEAKSGAPNFFQGLAKMYSDPKMKKAMQAQQAMGVRMMYGEFF